MPGEGIEPSRGGLHSFMWFVRSALIIAEMEARKIRHNSSELWIRAIQPALWLLIFGAALSGVRGISPSQFTYVQFISPGILSQSVLFVAIFYGVTLVWERDLGLLHKLLSTPAPRSSIVLGKAFAASVRGILQGVIVLALSLILGTTLNVSPANVAGVFIVIVLLGVCFSSMSMAIAGLARSRERMMGLSQVIVFPLFFASNAIYPTRIMPGWLQMAATLNPLSYGVQAIRALLLTGDYSMLGSDIIALGIADLVFLVLAALSIKRMLR